MKTQTEKLLWIVGNVENLSSHGYYMEWEGIFGEHCWAQGEFGFVHPDGKGGWKYGKDYSRDERWIEHTVTDDKGNPIYQVIGKIPN